MARKPRDYAKEYRNRVQRAAARGFKSPYAERRAVETGKIPARAPKRVKRESTWIAQRKYFKPAEPAKTNTRQRKAPRPQSRITPTEQRMMFGRDPEDVANDWSGLFAQTEMAQYDPDRAGELGVSRTQYRNAYLRAFVFGNESYSTARKHGGSDALYYWFVTLNGYMEAEEYDRRYGIHV